jgi:hypothetical protein
MKGTQQLNWLDCCGIVDRDHNSEHHDVTALNVYSVESLFYLAPVCEYVIRKVASLEGDDGNTIDTMISKAQTDALNYFSESEDRLVGLKVKALLREKVLSEAHGQLKEWRSGTLKINIDGSDLAASVRNEFKDLVKNRKLDELVALYPLKKTGIPGVVAKAVGISIESYQKTARQGLRQDATFRTNVLQAIGLSEFPFSRK